MLLGYYPCRGNIIPFCSTHLLGGIFRISAAGPESGNAWRSLRWPFWIFECAIPGALTKLSEAFSIAGQAIYPGRRNTSSEYKREYRCTECVLCAGGMQRNHVSRSVYINNVHARVISYRLRDAVQLTYLRP